MGSGNRPICLAVLPSKIDGDLDGQAAAHLERIFTSCIVSAAERNGFLTSRLDTGLLGGVAERGVLDRLLLSDVAVFDLSYPSAELGYLLGTRLALRPGASLVMLRDDVTPAHKLHLEGALLYRAEPGSGLQEIETEVLQTRLEKRLAAMSDPKRDTPGVNYAMYELVLEHRPVEISRMKTDAFRERVDYSESWKTRLAEARALGGAKAVAALRIAESALGELDTVDSAVIIDLLLSYRAVSAWSEVVRLFEALPDSMQRSTMLREQLAMSQNRLGQRHAALALLEDLESTQGSSSESSGLLGRVYKDLWQDAVDSGDEDNAKAYLAAAIAAYRRGFEADWRDAYPGVNVATLLNIEGSDDSMYELRRLLPVVRFAAEMRIANQRPDYWDHATLLELAVIGDDPEAAREHLAMALQTSREAWERETTARNLSLLGQLRERRNEEMGWVVALIDELVRVSADKLPKSVV